MHGAERRRPGSLTSRDPQLGLFPEGDFHALFERETVRSSRSGKSCLLMLLSVMGFEQAERFGFVPELTETLFSVTREIDVKGWWRTGSQIGILFTDVDASSPDTLHEVQSIIKLKILTALRARTGNRVADRIAVSWSTSPQPFLRAPNP